MRRRNSLLGIPMLVWIMVTSFGLYAQDFTRLSEFEYTDVSQFAEMEEQVAQAADYVLSVPLDPTDQNRLMAMQAIIKWMSGTPDYQFVIDETITRLTKKMKCFSAFTWPQ